MNLVIIKCKKQNKTIVLQIVNKAKKLNFLKALLSKQLFIIYNFFFSELKFCIFNYKKYTLK